jgi:hypothetical protein
MFFLGDYVLVEDIEEGDKVKAEIVQILLKDNIKYIRSQNCWQVVWKSLGYFIKVFVLGQNNLKLLKKKKIKKRD